MFASPAETLDTTEKVVHIVGMPALIGVIVWLIRAYDGGSRALKTIQAQGDETAVTVAAAKSAIDTIQSNHLAHMSEDIKNLSGAQDKSNEILTSIDKGIGILVDRGDRKDRKKV